MARRAPSVVPVRRWSWENVPRRQVPLRAAEAAAALPVLDFTSAMTHLCRDVIGRCPQLAHVALERVLVTMLVARSASHHGLQARLTPLRFAQGARERREGRTLFRVQRYEVAGVEMLYLLTFCVPRFFHMPFEEKLLTVFHELYHISPAFDGDLRRLPGRCAMHGRSKQAYDAHMGQLARAYLGQGPPESVLAVLRGNRTTLAQAYNNIRGVVVPRPMIYPVPDDSSLEERP